MRKVFFWLHLIAGSLAGIVILLMSVTGVLLTYERQMIAWADRGFQSTTSGASVLRPEMLLNKLLASEGRLPAVLNLHAGSTAPAEAQFDGGRVLYVDKYSGQVLGQGSREIREFFRGVTDWHRWLAMKDSSRATGRAITGACNLLFLFLVASGFYIWLPRKWSWQHFRPVLLFRSGVSGKARDFNWHNVIGIWSAVPLFIIVLGGVVISYPWATNLLYTLTGSEAPAAAAPRQAGQPRREEAPRGGRDVEVSGIDAAWAQAEKQVPGWRTISLRLPNSNRAPLAFSIMESHRGRPDKRSSLAIDRRTGAITQQENFASYNTGRRLRMWLRFLHTGEALGIVGQTIAGLVSAGGAVLVYTGITLAIRRFTAWRSRRRTRVSTPETVEV